MKCILIADKGNKTKILSKEINNYFNKINNCVMILHVHRIGVVPKLVKGLPC